MSRRLVGRDDDVPTIADHLLTKCRRTLACAGMCHNAEISGQYWDGASAGRCGEKSPVSPPPL
jgi:hypothetical protein